MDTRDYHRINSSITNKYFKVRTVGDCSWIVPQRDWLELCAMRTQEDREDNGQESLGLYGLVKVMQSHQQARLGDEDADAHPELDRLVGPFPARPSPWEVCPTCQGNGKHVSPNIDRYGISQQDFDDDPDFADSYFSGAYDVTCSQCDGLRVVRGVEPTTDNGWAFMDNVKQLVDDHWEHERECAAERRYMYGPEYEW